MGIGCDTHTCKGHRTTRKVIRSGKFGQYHAILFHIQVAPVHRQVSGSVEGEQTCVNGTRRCRYQNGILHIEVTLQCAALAVGNGEVVQLGNGGGAGSH